MAETWKKANAGISGIYYSDLIDKNPDPSVKELWQKAFGLVYKGLDILKKTTYAQQGIEGEGVDLQTVVPYFTETQGQMRNVLDEIYNTKGMLSSLEGRGRRILPQMELIYQQLESLRYTASTKDFFSYSSAFESFCEHCILLESVLKTPAPVPYAEVKKYPKEAILRNLNRGPGVLFVFSAIILLVTFFLVRVLSVGRESSLENLLERWKQKTKTLAYEYNRQFLGVGAKWLLYGPLIISVIFGLITLNLFVFILALFVFGYLLPTEGLKFVKERRRLRVESQLLDALILLSDAMRSGLDLVQGIELAGHEMAPPISEEFDLLLRNYKLGMPFDDALKAFDQRIESELVSYVVRAVIIQRQTGGNLTKIFDRIVDTIREEGRLKDKINALTAQPRYQSIVLSIIPWGMLMILYFFQPQMVGAFYVSFLGILTLLVCVFWQSIGIAVIRRMAKIEV